MATRLAFSVPFLSSGKLITGCSNRRLAAAEYEQRNPCRHSHSADYGRDPHRSFAISRDLYRPSVHYRFTGDIRETLVAKGQRAENDQNDADESHGFLSVFLGSFHIANRPEGSFPP
jgi:hypothetical protein